MCVIVPCKSRTHDTLCNVRRYVWLFSKFSWTFSINGDYTLYGTRAVKLHNYIIIIIIYYFIIELTMSNYIFVTRQFDNMGIQFF